MVSGNNWLGWGAGIHRSILIQKIGCIHIKTVLNNCLLEKEEELFKQKDIIYYYQQTNEYSYDSLFVLCLFITSAELFTWLPKTTAV